MVKKTQWVYLAHGFSLQSFRKQISYYSKKRPEPKEQASAQTITAVERKESDKVKNLFDDHDMKLALFWFLIEQDDFENIDETGTDI